MSTPPDAPAPRGGPFLIGGVAVALLLATVAIANADFGLGAAPSVRIDKPLP